MKSQAFFNISTGVIVLGLLFMNMMSFAQGSESGDKTLSPYFFIQTDNPGLDQLPLESTSAEVNIAGIIADVRMTQVYKNEGERPIEAVYIFPASTRAALYSMQMKIGERTIIARIEEKGKARQDYEDAKNQGKSASLLEQQRPNVFQMSVANIMPGDVIEVEMKYTELLIPEAGIYEFVYPTVVGPRYSNTPENAATDGEKWVENPYTHQGEKPFYTFDISVNLQSGLPVSDISCPSHSVEVTYSGKDAAHIALRKTDAFSGNRDFVLRYKLAGGRIESGILLYEGGDENFFLAMIQPPERITPDQLPPREYIFIMDVSGSMYGYPLDISKKLMKNLLKGLRPADCFNVLLFAGGSELFSPQSVPATPGNISNALRVIDEQQGGGGTELLPALQRVLSLRGHENYSRNIIIATDGYVTIEKEAFDLIRDNLGKANFFPFGIGTSVNRYLLEGMAHVGMGTPFVVTRPEEAGDMAEKFRNYIEFPVLTKIGIEYEGFSVYDVEPSAIPDVLADRPILVCGKWKGPAAGSVSLTGLTGNSCFRQTLELSAYHPSATNSALRYLWAREKIRLLDDYTRVDSYAQDNLIEEVTKLGLKYSLLTNYTSFVAIDSEVRNADGGSATIKQPLPLPDGVSDYAVGSQTMYQGSLGGGIGICAPDVKHKDGGRSSCEELIEVECDPVYVNGSNNVFTVVDTLPEFLGGEEALMEFIRNSLVYPPDLHARGIWGTVYLELVIGVDGSVKKIWVLRGVHPDLDQEAKRVLGLTSYMWKPGIQNGRAVEVRITVPVRFIL
jgi:Ca-activated chloride channel family protein